MKKIFTILFILSLTSCVSLLGLPDPVIDKQGNTPRTDETTFEELGLDVDNLVIQLDTPWDLVWGPDDFIWVTERPGILSRINPRTGQRNIIANIDVYERGESGLMGLAFHPDFDKNAYLYLSQSVRVDGEIINRLLRFRYQDNSLEDYTILIDNIPGNTYHDGSRLEFGPDGYLYMTTGDAGSSYLAQRKDSLAGKVLRVDENGNPAPGNPFDNEVFSYGHRNAQGLVYSYRYSDWYITEHGPRDNDEVAIVRIGENHGWPEVRGFCDGDAGGEINFCRTNDVTEPLAAWTPTIAPAGADFYTFNLITKWNGSFLFTTLKGSALVRLEFNGEGDRVVFSQVISEGEFGRLRDVLVGPDGTVYIATSNRDGRGRPDTVDDRILMIRPQE